MIKRFLATVMTLVILMGTTVYATDYSAQLAELEDLLSQCKTQNMSVPYETVGVETFKRFKTYLAKDEENDVSSEIMTYNDTAMQNLYTTTKANLTAYLNGTKTPQKVPVYNMMRTAVSGMGITDGKNNIISTGYGHFETVQSDIEKLHDFGAMNIQMETGPKNIIAVPDWKYSTDGSPEYYFDVVQDGDDRALKVVYKTEKADGKYFKIKQTVSVEPNTRYAYKISYKGTDVDDNAVTIKIKDGQWSYTIPSVSSSWQTSTTKTFTTGSSDTSIAFEIYIQDKCEELFIDDVIFKKYSGGENILANSDFENEYSQNNVEKICEILNRAKQSNVAVSFLLQPLYFWRIPGCEDMYSSTTGTSYNINDERAKAKIEQYLRTIVPIIAQYDAVRDICITNEPTFDTRTYPEFYNPLFRDYLLEEYGTLNNINSNYGTSYGSIDSITMPTEFAKTALFYDWVCFNEDMLTEWHSWMASIIKEYTNKPLHSKMENYIMPSEYSDRRHLIKGTDIEKFAQFIDYAGNDAANSMEWEPSMMTKMMWYDYLYSVVKKPIYNSEDHFIKDGSTKYDEEQKNATRYNLWQGAIHGRAMSTLWTWDRSYDTSSHFYNGVLTRPDCVAEVGYTSLDMMRNANDILKLSSKQPDVALFYSKTSRIFNDDHMGNLTLYYKALLCSGKRVGFVTESSLENLSDYQCLIIPSVTHTTPEAVTAVKNYISNGGKVIYYEPDNNCMKYDKFGKALSNSTITSNGTRWTVKDTNPVRKKVIEYFANDRIRIKDNATNDYASGVEYEYSIDGGKVLVNIVKIGTGTQTVSVYLDGNKLSGMTNIVTGETTGGNHTITGYVPLTLKYSTDTPSKPKNLTYDADILSWDSEESAVKYNVYYKEKNGAESLYKVTNDSYCIGRGDGVYRVEGVNSSGVTGESAKITVEPAFEIAFNNVEVTQNSVFADVNVRNVSSRIKRAVIEIKTGEGKIAVSDIWIAPMAETWFKASFEGTTEVVTASVGESYEKQNIYVEYETTE